MKASSLAFCSSAVGGGGASCVGGAALSSLEMICDEDGAALSENAGGAGSGSAAWSYGTSFVFLSEAATVGDGEFWFVLFIGHNVWMQCLEILKLNWPFKPA